jgi:hypothetical protein
MGTDTQDTSDITSIGTRLNDEGTPEVDETPATADSTATTDPAAQAATPDKTDPPATTPETKADAETDDEDVQPGDTPQKTAARTRGRLQKRIDTISERAYRAEGRAQQLEHELAELRRRPTQTPDPQTPTPPQPPAAETFRFTKTPEDFTTYEEYLDARDDARDAWREQQTQNKVAAEQARAASERAAASERDLAQKAAERLPTFKATHPDWDQVVPQMDLVVNRDVLNELHASEHGADIVYALAKDPTFRAAFAAMSTAQQLREIGRREAALAGTPATSGKPAGPAKAKPTTTAPAPLETEGAPSAGVRDESELSTDDRIDLWQRQERDARRRRLGLPA